MAQPGPNGPPPGQPGSRGPEPDHATETAAYIAELTRELARMARRSRLEVVAYLLEMAELEAKAKAGPDRPLTGSPPET